MKKTLLLLFISIIFISCNNVDRKEHEKILLLNTELKNKIENLQAEIESYKYSPEKMLVQAEALYKNKNLEQLQLLEDKVIKYHPESDARKKISNYTTKLTQLRNDSIEKVKKDELRELQKIEKAKKTVVSKLKKKYDDISGNTWYQQKYFTHYNDANATSLYIGKSSTSVWLRLKMSYGGEDWIFFNKAILSCDGYSYEVYFDDYKDKKSDNSGYGVWEWIDISVDSSLLYYLRDVFIAGKNPKMRLTGKYTTTRNLNRNEIQGIKDILLAYEVLLAE